MEGALFYLRNSAGKGLSFIIEILSAKFFSKNLPTQLQLVTNTCLYCEPAVGCKRALNKKIYTADQY